MERTGDPDLFRPDGYAVFDASAAWEVVEDVRLKAAILNVFDARHFQAPYPGLDHVRRRSRGGRTAGAHALVRGGLRAGRSGRARGVRGVGSGRALLMTGAGAAWGVYSLHGRGPVRPLADTTAAFSAAAPAAVALWLGA